MRRTAICILAILFLLLTPSAHAQKKQKDPVLQAYLEQSFADLSSKLSGLADRLSVLEGELAKLKQQQAEIMTEARSAGSSAKTTDSTLSSFRGNVQQDLLSLRTDLARLQRDMTTLMESLRKPEPAPAPGADVVREGYITADGEKEVTINLGLNAGLKAGMRFNVFRASDLKTQIGVIEIVEVLDASNSRAKVVHKKADVAKFEFSDVVKPQ
jgi:ABC-type transporter Mla subunit MlaD